MQGRNSSKAPISRLSFFLFSDKSGNPLDSLSELAASSAGCCPMGSGFVNWMRMLFLDLRVMLGNGSIHSENQPQAEPPSKRGQQHCRFHHLKASPMQTRAPGLTISLTSQLSSGG